MTWGEASNIGCLPCPDIASQGLPRQPVVSSLAELEEEPAPHERRPEALRATDRGHGRQDARV